MEKNIIVLDHTSLLKSYEFVSGERILELSKNVDKVFRVMSRRRRALDRIAKAKSVFNI